MQACYSHFDCPLIVDTDPEQNVHKGVILKRISPHPFLKISREQVVRCATHVAELHFFFDWPEALDTLCVNRWVVAVDEFNKVVYSNMFECWPRFPIPPYARHMSDTIRVFGRICNINNWWYCFIIVVSKLLNFAVTSKLYTVLSFITSTAYPVGMPPTLVVCRCWKLLGVIRSKFNDFV